MIVRMETDDPTDDILCESESGRRAWIQAKHQVAVGARGAGLAPVVRQWAGMIRRNLVRPGEGLVLAVGELTKPLEALRTALDLRRDPHAGALIGEHRNALTILTVQIQDVAPDLDLNQQQLLLDAAVVWHVAAADAENAIIGRPVLGRHAQMGAAILGTVVAPVAAPKAMALLTAAARTFAQRRSGADMATWREVLIRGFGSGGVVGSVSQSMPVAGRLGLPLAACDPLVLEVHRAIDVPGQDSLTAPLPPYVTRAHDVLLREIADMVSAGASRMVTLVGSSSTGKTRACWETATYLDRKQPGRWRLWHPYQPTRTAAAIDGLDQVTPYTIIWLNELQSYLAPTDTDTGERIAAALRHLLADVTRRPVLVLATVWKERWRDLTRRSEDAMLDPYPQARELLSGTDVDVPDAFTAQELADLQTGTPDPRLRYAAQRAEGGRVAQYVAGAPELLARLRKANPPARAVLDAAIDARRLGHPSGLPLGLLSQAAPGYLDDHDWDNAGADWLERTFDYAGERGTGRLALLIPPRPRAGEAPPANAQPVYRLADYIEQTGAAERYAVFPPSSLWDALLNTTDQYLLFAFGRQAFNRGRYSRAVAFYQRAAIFGNGHAVAQAASLWDRAGDKRSAEAICVDFLNESSNNSIRFFLGDLRERAGDIAQAETLYRQAAVSHSGAVSALTRILSDTGRYEEAQAFAREAAALGYTDGLTELASQRKTAHDRPGAEAFYRKAIGNGDTRVLMQLAALRQTVGDVHGAERLFEQAVNHGHTSALVHLGEIRERRGDTTGAEAMYQRATDYGHYGVYELRALRHYQAGAHARAEQLARQAAEHGHFNAMTKLLRLKTRDGDRAGAERLHEELTRYGRRGQLTRLAQIRTMTADIAGAEKLARQGVDAGEPGSLDLLAKLQRQASREEADRIYRFGLDDHGAAATELPPYNGRRRESQPSTNGPD